MHRAVKVGLRGAGMRCQAAAGTKGRAGNLGPEPEDGPAGHSGNRAARAAPLTELHPRAKVVTSSASKPGAATSVRRWMQGARPLA